MDDNQNTQEKKARTARANDSQKVALLKFIEDNPDLKSGKFTAAFTARRSMQLWEELSAVLNRLDAEKDMKTWRKYWNDLRGYTKRKYGEKKEYSANRWRCR